MSITDDEGRLFGRVNVIDVLAVLLVAAVVIAGAAFVLQDDSEPKPPDTGTTYATIDAGTVPSYIASEVDAGDSYSPSENSKLTVTDVHLAPGGRQTRAILRVALEGVVNDDSVDYDGAPPRLGRSLTIVTDVY